jgi:hypothetical protein
MFYHIYHLQTDNQASTELRRSWIKGAGHSLDNIMLCCCGTRCDHFFVDYKVELPSQRDEKLRIAGWGIEDDPLVNADLTLFLMDH